MTPSESQISRKTRKVLEKVDANQNEIGALNEQASEEMVSSGSERSFRPDMVSSGSSKVKEPENPKEVESVADKVADEVDTVDEVVVKVEKPVVESNAVESDSLNEPNENDEKSPEPVPKKEDLESAPALATKSTYGACRKSQKTKSRVTSYGLCSLKLD